MTMKKLQHIIFFAMICLTMNAQAGMQQHGKHKADKVPEMCTKADAVASLQCARAPSATFDVKGRLWLAWAFGGHVYVNFSDDKGMTYSPPVAVNKVPEKIAARGENRPKIVINSVGWVFVSWTQKLPKRFSGHIRFSRSINGGKYFSQPITVNDHLEITSHRFESLAVNTKGDIYIAWLDKRDKLASKAKGQDYTGAALYYAVSTDGGKSFHRNNKVIDHSCECCRTAMAIDNDGLPVILWRHIFDKNTRDHALVKLTSTKQFGDVRRVSFEQWQVDGCPHHGPDISISNQGVYHLAWFNNAPKQHGLFYANTQNQGQTFSKTINFGNYKAAAAHPQVLSFRNKVYLLWKEFDGKHSSLMSMQSNDKGVHWSKANLLMKTTSTTDHPLLIHNGEQVYAVWHRRGEDYRLIAIND